MRVLVVSALLCFVIFGWLAIPTLGLEDDELIYINLFFHPNDAFSRLPLWDDHAIPGMAASYAGALKTWLASPLLWFSPSVSVWAVRLPTLLLGVLTIVLMGRLLPGAGGAIVTLLLATDITFLFTSVFDWGPVVIQQLGLVTILWLLLAWYRTRNQKLLFLGGLAIGLTLWDKSLFLWQLLGLTIAFVVSGWPVLRSVWSRANVWLLARGILLGTVPLMAANFRHHFATIRDNAHTSWAFVAGKLAFLQAAIDGQAITTFLVEGSKPLSLWRFYPCLSVITLALLVTRGERRRWILFFVISGAGAWLESAMTKNAGDLIHHAVLIWIEWYAAIALSFAALLTRPSLVLRTASYLLLAVLCCRGVWAIAAGCRDLKTLSGTSRWTDADAALARSLQNAGIQRVIVTDWGIRNVLRSRSNERIQIQNESVHLLLGQFDQSAYTACRSSDCALIEHAQNRNVFAHAPETLARSLAAYSLLKADEHAIYDSHHKLSFTWYRLR